MSTLYHCGFVPYVHSYTRVTHETNSCIDHIFVREKTKINNLICKSFVVTSNVTEHCPIILHLSLRNYHHMKDKIEYCKSTKTDYVKFAKFLEEQDWNNVLSCNNVKLATNIFVNTFSDNIEKSKVIKTIKIKHYNRTKTLDN